MITCRIQLGGFQRTSPYPGTSPNAKRDRHQGLPFPSWHFVHFIGKDFLGREVRRPVRLHHPIVLYIYRYTRVRSENQYAPSSCFLHVGSKHSRPEPSAGLNACLFSASLWSESLPPPLELFSFAETLWVLSLPPACS